MKRESLPPNKTKLSFFRLTRCTPVEEAAANEKKEGVFPRLIGQMPFNALFFRINGPHDVDQWEKKIAFFPPNRTKPCQRPLDALNVPH